MLRSRHRDTKALAADGAQPLQESSLGPAKVRPLQLAGLALGAVGAALMTRSLFGDR